MGQSTDRAGGLNIDGVHWWVYHHQIDRLALPGTSRRKANKVLRSGKRSQLEQTLLHGAQDGQKFMGVFMLGLYFNNLVEKAATALRSLCG